MPVVQQMPASPASRGNQEREQSMSKQFDDVLKAVELFDGEERQAMLAYLLELLSDWLTAARLRQEQEKRKAEGGGRKAEGGAA